MNDDLTCTGCGEYAGEKIAARIEELERERDTAIKWVQKKHAAADLYANRIEALNARIEELEAKLAGAVEQMQRVKDFRYDPNIGVELNMLEATLEELKGQDDE